MANNSEDTWQANKELARRLNNWKRRYNEEVQRNEELEGGMEKLLVKYHSQNRAYRDLQHRLEQHKDLYYEQRNEILLLKEKLQDVAQKFAEEVEFAREDSLVEHGGEEDNQEESITSESGEEPQGKEALCGSKNHNPSIPVLEHGCKLFEYAVVVGIPPPKSSRDGGSKLQFLKRTRSTPEQRNLEKKPGARSSNPSWIQYLKAEGTRFVNTKIKSPRDLDHLDAKSPHGTPPSSSWVSKIVKRETHSDTNTKAVGYPLNALSLSTAKPRVLASYPSNWSGKSVEALMEFCFPNGILVNKHVDSDVHSSTNDAFFVMKVSGDMLPRDGTDQQNLYAVCFSDHCSERFGQGIGDKEYVRNRSTSQHTQQSPEPTSQQNQQQQQYNSCFCIVTRFPFFKFFLSVLQCIIEDPSEAHVKSRRPPRTRFFDILHELHAMEVPCLGGTLSFRNIHLRRVEPHLVDESEEAVQLREWALPALFAALSMDKILFLLGCLCNEMQVVLISTHFHLLSASCFSLASLLEPLEWCGPIVSILPTRFHEILEAPVPLLVGITSLPSNFNHPQGLLTINLDTQSLEMHPTDMVLMHEVKLLDFEELLLTLSKHTEAFAAPQLVQTRCYTPSKTQIHATNCISQAIRRQIEHICQIALRKEDSEELSSPFIQRLVQTQGFHAYREKASGADRIETRVSNNGKNGNNDPS